jgi:protein-S-isoprenylcysteine O-methyltransferase Ste14
MRVVDHAMPRWIAPAMAVAFATYFPVQDLAGPGVRHAMVFVFSLGFVGFVVGPVIRQRRAARSGLRADPVPAEHRRRAQLAATVLLVLLLGGVLLLDHLTWPHVALAYGLALAGTVLAGGWWLRRTLARQLRALPSPP